MQVMNKGSIADVAKEFAGGVKKDSPAHANFFDPLNEMDPLTRRPKTQLKIPEFKFRIFHLAGPGCDPAEGSEYSRVMNQITRGECQLLDSNTYHSKDGDIRVFVQWLQFPDGLQKALEIATGDPNSGLGATPESQEGQIIPLQQQGSGKKKRRKKKKKRDQFVGSCPAPEPKITM